MLFDAPVIAPARGLDPSWLDHNGHLNMAYYNVLFDQAVDHAFGLIGCGPEYVTARKMSFFTAEAHICYLRELKPDAVVAASVQLVDFDSKRVHLFQELRHVDGWLSATSETLILHVDMTGPRAAPMPDDVLANVTSMAAAHRHLARPERAGRSIGIVRKQTHRAG
ncbi:thioesterase family protein [Hoeflea sp. YIM 152468]|uniref:thioesterase family protein n=1 Tax=Hoeflea sp. YIM 152468 TaxID=3031759 RepID=UPI0023DB26E0|nr:thioesterase family protein [Hoeflea sp. YIM 152468]MDF1608461.1 thioesterase family protein [Hoeflea sp. YIM 152468]